LQPEVYLAKDGILRHIPSPSEFEKMGYKWEDIRDVAPSLIEAFKTGTPITQLVQQIDQSVSTVQSIIDEAMEGSEVEALEGEQEPDEIKWEDVENRVHLRKFDSEDIVRLRGATIVTSGEDKQTKVNIETGELQKRAIVMAIRSCPWFEDIVHERIGVNAPMFRKRMSEEFRQIPVDILDKLFRVCMEHNKNTLASAEFEKSLKRP